MAVPRSLRFCMITTFYPPYHFGGDAVYVYRLAESLAAKGHRVDVIHSIDAYRLSHPAEPEVAFTHHPNVVRHPLSSPRPRVAALVAHQLGRPGYYGPQLREILESRSYDVVHYHNVSLMGAPQLFRLGQAVKLYTANDYWLICPTHVLFAFNRAACTQRHCLACTLHSRRPPQNWRWTKLLEQCLRQIDCLLMPSQFALEKHRTALDRPMVNLSYLISPPDREPSRPAPSIPDRPFFLFVGRLEKLKGVQDLLRLFEEYRAADLVIVGAGSYARALRDQARDLPHVTFLDATHPAALGELYRRAIAVLVPSLCYETFGLTAAEALAHGTPAIVRRIGALTEIVGQGGGFAFDSLEECREAMELLRTRPDLRAAVGQEGHRVAQSSWTAEIHLQRYLNLVESLMRQESSRKADTSVEPLEPFSTPAPVMRGVDAQ